MRVSVIVAADVDDAIGRQGEVPWKIGEDLRNFKALTSGHLVLMGRQTYDSIVASLGRPLPNRHSVVVTHQAREDADNVTFVTPESDDVGAELVALCNGLAAARGDDEWFVIGGGQIYGLLMPYVGRVYLTRVMQHTYAADAFMPQNWLSGFESIGPPVRRRTDLSGYGLEWQFESFIRMPARRFYHFANSRSPEQTEDMARLELDGVCIFCPEQLHADPDQRIDYQSQHWIVTQNEFPYSGTRYHWLLVPKRHVEDLADLEPDEFADMLTILRVVRDKYGLAAYGLGSRNGDPAYTGATIRHVHVHLIVGEVDDPMHEPVKMKLSSRPQQ